LAKGGGALEALARAHTVLFDKTGTLTVGGARLLSVEVAPGEDPDEVLTFGASLEQASHHVLAKTVVAAAIDRGLKLKAPEQVKKTMGTGLSGLIDGRHDNQTLFKDLDRLRKIIDALDDAMPESAAALIGEAQRLVQSSVVMHDARTRTASIRSWRRCCANATASLP
jgi:cation transport ATPase